MVSGDPAVFDANQKCKNKTQKHVFYFIEQ